MRMALLICARSAFVGGRSPALFSLADKLSPCIVFIDEIDSLLPARTTLHDDSASAAHVMNSIHSMFLQYLDGIQTKSLANQTNRDSRVLVIGATNFPNQLDGALLRRFSKQILFPLPKLDERVVILKVILKINYTLIIKFFQINTRLIYLVKSSQMDL